MGTMSAMSGNACTRPLGVPRLKEASKAAAAVALMSVTKDSRLEQHLREWAEDLVKCIRLFPVVESMCSFAHLPFDAA